MIASITGWGLATPLGLTASETWQNLLAGGTILDHARVPTPHSLGRSRVTQLALMAARESLSQSGWTQGDLLDDQTALVIGTSKGPVEEWLTPPQEKSARPPATPHHFTSYGLAQIATDLSAELPLGPGPRLTLSAACASGLHALIRAVMMLQSGEAGRVLVVAVESSLHPLFQGCFQRLGVLPKPGVGCRPFDEHRDGFLMSEAAAAVCLETVDDSHRRPGRLYVERYALGGSAGHLTAGEADGAVLRKLLTRVIDGRPVDLIHAHGTGTRMNDAVELAAIESVLEKNSQTGSPILYSHKGALGHSLGAAGLVAVVLNCFMHAKGRVPPNINTTTRLPTRRIILSREMIPGTIRRSVAAASGFGGPTAVVSLCNV